MLKTLRNLIGRKRPEPHWITAYFDAWADKWAEDDKAAPVLGKLVKAGMITREQAATYFLPSFDMAQFVYSFAPSVPDLPNDLVAAFQKLADDAEKEGLR